MWLQAGVLCLVTVVCGKVYDRCELARELVTKHEAPMHQVATWVCIAQHESQFNTSAVGDLNGGESKDHGIFQISDLYWCSPPGNGWACGVTCAELEDDDIEDDFICARRIYREHKLLSGDGFNAWVVYHTHCSGQEEKHIEACFNATDTKTQKSTTSKPLSSPTSPSTTTSTTTSTLLKDLTESRGRVLPSNKFGVEPNKPWFNWFSRYRWS